MRSVDALSVGCTPPPAGSRTTAACAGRCRARTRSRAWPPRDRNRPNPVRGVLRDVLLHERRRPEPDPDDGQRSLLQPGQDRIADGVEVIDEVALGRARPVEQRLVQMSERYAVAILAAAHSLTLPPDMPLVVVVLVSLAVNDQAWARIRNRARESQDSPPRPDRCGRQRSPLGTRAGRDLSRSCVSRGARGGLNPALSGTGT